jgi:hypothetical protein
LAGWRFDFDFYSPRLNFTRIWRVVIHTPVGDGVKCDTWNVRVLAYCSLSSGIRALLFTWYMLSSTFTYSTRLTSTQATHKMNNRVNNLMFKLLKKSIKF